MPADQDERLAQIRTDLAYFQKACATMGGGQPPTVYADKYAADVEYLLKFVPVASKPEVPKTQMELDLAHDEAGRVERKRR